VFLTSCVLINPEQLQYTPKMHSQSTVLPRLVAHLSRRSLSTLPVKFEAALKAIPGINISTNPYELDRHGRGESYHKPYPPQSIVHVASEAEVIAVLKLCNEFKVPVVPFGAGTSVEGHVGALHGGVSLSFCQSFNKILRIDAASMDATVQAGVTRHQLNNELRHTGLQFMVDPGADASIGGMTATGASGTSAVKYGTMKENVLGCRAILSTGEVIKCGGRARKNSAGLDLTRLMIGSEGTLGVITEVTVKLHPIPNVVSAAVCKFPSISEAANAITAILQSGIAVSKCELMDSTTMEAYNKYATDVPDMPLVPHLFLEFTDISEGRVVEQANLAAELCSSFSGSEFQFSQTPSEQKKLWSARHSVYYASIALRKDAKGVVTDACVPLDHLAQILVDTSNDVKAEGIVGSIFGHAGDGNFHVVLPIVSGDESNGYLEKVHRVMDNISKRAIAAGGTCTGEHGVGVGKLKYLEEQYNSSTISAMRRIKIALDPNNILNPGKIGTAITS
jgi:D-lactate dehydrogenase (cytochrome)